MKKRFLILILALVLLCACGANRDADAIPAEHMAAIRQRLAELEQELDTRYVWQPGQQESLQTALNTGVQIGEPIRLYEANPRRDRYDLMETTYYPLLFEGEFLHLLRVYDQRGTSHVSLASEPLVRLLELEGADCPKAFVVDAEFYYLYTEEHGFEKWYGHASKNVSWYQPSKGDVQDDYSTGAIELSNAMTENGQTWPVELGE